MTAALSITDLAVAYDNGLRAVDGISFDAAEGEIVALLGPSGCGKSSTLRCIAGLEDLSEGTIDIEGRRVAGPGIFVPPQKRGINMVFQSYAVWPHLTVYENVAYGLRARGVSRGTIEGRVAAALATVQLSELATRYPWQLSGGQQQRVALARAVVTEPSLILFDEPLSNLDAGLRVQMRQEISTLQRTLGKTAIYVTHDQEEAMAIADRIVLMNGGKIEQIGTPAEIYDVPQSKFAATFIGTANVIDGVFAGTDDTNVAAVRLPSGGLIKARLGKRRPQPGEAVSVVIRPEAVHFHAPSSPATSLNQWEGTLAHSVYLGGRSEQTVRTNDLTLMAEGRAGSALCAGDPVTITVRSDDALVL
ncbi:MAG: ABC transporter ATP-binding protein [Xanthobacteraceae bacterium]